jgi:hypothetical protein
MSNYSLIGQFSDIEMIEFPFKPLVVRKRTIVLQTTGFKNIESQVLRCQNQNTSKKEVFVLYVNNIEILCDDEEFVYDGVYCHLIYQAVEKTVNPTVFQRNEIQRHRRGMEEDEVNTCC